MQKILITVCLLCAHTAIFSQNTVCSIRITAKNHVLNSGDLHPNADTESPGSIMLMVYDVFNKKDIVDNNYLASLSDTLSYYRIVTLRHHSYIQIMFSKNGKCIPLNMRKSLPDIMKQAIELCETLDLDRDESLYVFKETIKCAERNTSVSKAMN